MNGYTQTEEVFLERLESIKGYIQNVFLFIFFVNLLFLPYLCNLELFSEFYSWLVPVVFNKEEHLFILAKASVFLANVIIPIFFFVLTSNYFYKLNDNYHNQCLSYRNSICTTEINLALNEVRGYRRDTAHFNDKAQEMLNLLVKLCNEAFSFRQDISEIISLQADVEKTRVHYHQVFLEVKGILDVILSISQQLEEHNVDGIVAFFKVLQEKERKKFEETLKQLEEITKRDFKKIRDYVFSAIDNLNSNTNKLNKVSGIIDNSINKAKSLDETIDNIKRNLDYFTNIRN